MRKGEIVWKSLKFVIWERVNMTSAICFNLDKSKILSPGNGLNPQTLNINNKWNEQRENFFNYHVLWLSSDVMRMRYLCIDDIILVFFPTHNKHPVVQQYVQSVWWRESHKDAL